MATTPPIDPGFADEASYERFREVLGRTGFHPRGFAGAYGTGSVDAFRARSLPQQVGMTAGGRPIDVLTRLFVMRHPVPEASLGGVIAPMGVEEWARAGLVERRGDGVVLAVVAIAFFENLVLAHDADEGLGDAYVMGVARTTALLAMQSVVRPPGLALDLGTGCGVVALLSSRVYEGVLGTDVNPRAVAMARFNARVNGVGNVEFRVGDLFEPARAWLSERGRAGFRAIYANLPFVITPGGGRVYFASDRPGDGIVEAFVRGAPGVLEAGGVAQAVANWEHRAGEGWEARVAGWVEGSGCDMLVVQHSTVSPMDYATKWIDETEKGSSAEERWKSLARWMEGFGSRRVEGISYGLLTISRPAGGGPTRAPWFAVEQASEDLPGAVGAHLASMIAARDLLALLGAGADAALAGMRLVCSPNLRVERRYRPQASGATIEWKEERSVVRMAQGYAFPRDMDARQVEFVMALDGKRSVGEVAAEIAGRARAPAGALLPVCLKLARELLVKGYVAAVG